MARTSDTPSCKQCHSYNTMRGTRKTFMERVVLPRIGLYPWRCMVCKCRFLWRSRGLRSNDGKAAMRHGPI
jgi:hypothetical protein